MKICRFGPDRIGEVVDGRVIDMTGLVDRLSRDVPPGSDPLIAALPALLAGSAAERRTGTHYRLDEVFLRAPIRAPGKIMAAPVNYRKHIKEAQADPGVRYGHSITDIKDAGLFLKASSALAGPHDPLVVRFPERRTDYEIELVAVIGTGGNNIAEEDALRHIAGYAVGLDITLRGPEDRSFRKSIDGYAIVGPWLTTADDIPNPDALGLQLHLNGKLKQKANTSDMVFGVARLISFASSFYSLQPGDLLFTGTPEGVGPIASGDRLLAMIEDLGEMVIRVA